MTVEPADLLRESPSSQPLYVDHSALPATWLWCGYAHHFIGAESCRYSLATWVANGRYLVSTVGDYRPDPAKPMKPLGLGEHSLFETMVFAADPDNRDSEGEPTVTDWGGLETDRYATAAAATAGHLNLCRQYEQAGS